MRTNKTLKFLQILCGISLVSFMTACASQPVDDSAEWTPSKSAVNSHIYLSETNAILYPPQAETNQLRNAYYAAVTSCMQKQGFSYTPTDANSPSLDLISMNEKAIENVYEYVSEEDAVKYGVAAPGWYDQNAKAPDDKISSPEDRALYGDENSKNPSGCVNEAMKEVLPKYKRMVELEQEATNISVQAADAISTTKYKAAAAWNKCMKNEGYTQFLSPSSLSSPKGDEAPDMSWPAPNPGIEEIKATQAASRCMLSTRYLEKVSKAEALAVHKILAKKPGLIAEWQELRQDSLKKSKNISGEN